MNLSASFATKPNTREFFKPNEDVLLCDASHGIFLMLDGITRVHAEYDEGGSAAADVSRLFADTVYAELCDATTDDGEDAVFGALLQAAEAGNRAVAAYRARRTKEEWQFYPGTLGILAVQRDDMLYAVYAGDCLGVRLRGDEKVFFGEQASLKAVDRLAPTKAERYERYCNRPESELAYAVFNGDDTAVALTERIAVDVRAGDVVLLVSDGLAAYVRETSVGALRTADCDEMMDRSAVYDVPPYASYADDKSVIKITFAPSDNDR